MLSNTFSVLTPKSKQISPSKTPSTTPIKSLKGLDMTPLESKKVKRVEITPKSIVQLVEEKFTTKKIIRTRQCMFGTSCRFRNVAKTNGFPCDFAHTPEEMNTVAREVRTVVQNLEKTKPCWSGLHCTTKGCTFAHTPDELNVRTCYLGGNCTSTDCAYAHPGVKIDKVLLYNMMRKSQEKEKMDEMGPAPVLETTEEEILNKMRELENKKFEVQIESDSDDEEDVQTLTEQFPLLTVSEQKEPTKEQLKQYKEEQAKCACSETQKCGFHSDPFKQFASDIKITTPVQINPDKKFWGDMMDELLEEEKNERLQYEAEQKKNRKQWNSVASVQQPIQTESKPTVVTFKASTENKTPQTIQKQQTPKKSQRTQFPLYYRTNMCRNGSKCKRGERCDFAHSKSELKPVCCQEENCENDDCKFYHEGDPLPSSDELYQDWKNRTN
jgi:hypothetical protein